MINACQCMYNSMLHGNSVEGPFHVSKSLGNAFETCYLKVSVWKLSENLRLCFGNSCFYSENARNFQLVMTCCYDFYFSYI